MSAPRWTRDEGHYPIPAPAVKDADVPHTTLPATDPGYAAAERGRYLAKVACMNCHTQEATENGKIVSVNVQPFHLACCRGA